MEELVKEVIFYSIINSFMVYGLHQTILKIIDKEIIHRFWGLGITYSLGFVMGFMLTNGDPVWQKLLWALSVGACSVAIYKSAVQSLLGIIPALVEKIFGSQTQVINKDVNIEDKGEGN